MQLPESELRSAAPLLEALQDLKRMRRAGADGTLAGRAFLSAWASLCKGAAPRDVARTLTIRALVDNQLAGLEPDALLAAGVDEAKVRRIFRSALSASLEGGFENHPLAGGEFADGLEDPADAPGFAQRLACQPRAGATHPTEGRLYLHPPESHAEHCWGVAVYGILLAPSFGADPEPVLLAALGHHLHNAFMPDGGFAGEMLLEPDLAEVMAAFRQKALGELPSALAERVEAAVEGLDDMESPDALAFHAADVLDRVLDVGWRANAAGFTLKVATERYGLVHEGPQKAFHDSVLAAAGVA